jgi:hypothetical protein
MHPARPDAPVHTVGELLAEGKRLERRGRELLEQLKALASAVAEARAISEDRRSRR